MIKAIDISVHGYINENAARFLGHSLWKFLDGNPEFDAGTHVQVVRGTGASWQEKMRKGWTVEEIIEQMDEGNIEKSILISPWFNDGVGKPDMFVPAEDMAKAIEKYPDRFVGQVGVNPLKRMETVRYIERAVKEYGFKAVHIYPHWFGAPVNDKIYYPIYAKCAELDIPVCMQIAMPCPSGGGSGAGHPLFLDQIALDFPELRIVALHWGYPWAADLISMCIVHENIYNGVDVYPPPKWHPILVDYINTMGKDKCMFGTGWPNLPFAATIEMAKEKIKSEDILRKFLRDNAIKVYKL